MSFVTTHILDTAAGKPASGLTVTMKNLDGKTVATGVTNEDGRITDFGPDALASGTYIISFDVAGYYPESSFFTSVALTVTLDENAKHYHIPLLLSPYSISSYRGS